MSTWWRHIILAAILLLAVTADAQPRILAEIRSGIETKKHYYEITWVCTGDTLAVDSTEANGKLWQIDGFWITCTEATRDLWNMYMGSGANEDTDLLLPVTGVTREEADAFCHKMNSILKTNWRLPTDKEWRFAFAGGIFSEKYRFSGSNNAEWVAWTSKNSDGQLHRGGLRICNELGIYDMSGNVAEMVVDNGTKYAGGCYLDDLWLDESEKPEIIGFRIVSQEPLWFDKNNERVYYRRP